MDVSTILNDINNLIKVYDKNMDYEESYIKSESIKIVQRLEEAFYNFGYRSYHLTATLEQIIDSNLNDGYRANTNTYRNAIEDINANLRRIIHYATEEKMNSEELNIQINKNNEDFEFANRQRPYDVNIEEIFANILCTLRRTYPVDNEDFWYEIKSMLRRKQDEVIETIGSVRKSNSELFADSLKFVEQIGKENSKNSDSFEQIDKDIEKQANSNYTKYGAEFAQMLNMHFSMISYEILKQLHGTDQIEQQQIQELAMKLLKEKYPEFNDNYRRFCDSLSSYLIPQLTKRAKEFISEGKNVNLDSDKKVQEEVARFSYSGDSLVGRLDKDAIEDFDKEPFGMIVIRQCGLEYNDPRSKKLISDIDRKVIELENSASKLKQKIIFENVMGVQNIANNSLEIQHTNSNAFIG